MLIIEGVERMATKDQGVWIGEFGRWFADVGGAVGGPFDTCGDALRAYVGGWTPRTKRQASIFAWEQPPTAPPPVPGAAEGIPRTDLGQLVASALPAIQIYRRDLQYFIVQGESIIHLAFEGMPVLIRALEQAISRPADEFWSPGTLVGEAFSINETAPDVPPDADSASV